MRDCPAGNDSSPVGVIVTWSSGPTAKSTLSPSTVSGTPRYLTLKVAVPTSNGAVRVRVRIPAALVLLDPLNLPSEV